MNFSFSSPYGTRVLQKQIPIKIIRNCLRKIVSLKNNLAECLDYKCLKLITWSQVHITKVSYDKKQELSFYYPPKEMLPHWRHLFHHWNWSMMPLVMSQDCFCDLFLKLELQNSHMRPNWQCQLQFPLSWANLFQFSRLIILNQLWKFRYRWMEMYLKIHKT